MRCIACNELLKESELQIDEDFCKKCFKSYRDATDELNSGDKNESS